MLPASFNFLAQCPPPDNGFFSLDDLRDDDEIVQNSPLLSLNDDILEKIVSYVPLKERLNSVQKVSRKMSKAVQNSIKSVAFFKDQLDYYDNTKLLYFLTKYGAKIDYLNYDLFRSCGIKEYTQWSYRQSVIQTVSRCPQLRHLDILVCSRHRLRDGDLAMVFKNCPHLETLKMDAQYIIGHSFLKAPLSIRCLELELCNRLVKYFFSVLCTRLYKLKVLHVSQLYCLDEKVIQKIVNMKDLQQLSIVAEADKIFPQCHLSEIRQLSNLKTLCLEGLNLVTDRFLTEFCDPNSSNAAKTIESISLAYCMNIGSSGLQNLAQCKKLKNLNLDGVTKRDISMGLEAIAKEKSLERLFVADEAFVTPESLTEIVKSCPTLRLVDISNNKHLIDPHFGSELALASKSRQSTIRLVVLTDTESTWQYLPPYSPYNCIELVHLHRLMMSLPYQISPNCPIQLGTGLLMPDLRKGNRYRMLMAAQNEKLENPAGSEAANNDEMIIQQQAQLLSEMIPFVPPASFDDLPALNEILALLENGMYPISLPTLVPPSLPPVIPTTSDFLTFGSGGAPRPPSEETKENSPPVNLSVPKYTRANRPQRKARKELQAKRKSQESPVVPKRIEPQFTDEDFPPLR